MLPVLNLCHNRKNKFDKFGILRPLLNSMTTKSGQDWSNEKFGYKIRILRAKISLMHNFDEVPTLDHFKWSTKWAGVVDTTKRTSDLESTWKTTPRK